MPVSIAEFKKAFGTNVSKEMVDDRGSKVDAAIKTLSDEADKLSAAGFDTGQMQDQAESLTKARANAGKIKDSGKRYKALESIKKEAEDAVEHSKALSKATKDIMGASKDPPSDEQRSAAYKKALEVLYKMEIKVPKGMTQTHFDKVFDMFGSVPKEHVSQDKLKKLVYSKKKDDAGSGAYTASTGEIEMGNFGDATGDETYKLNGKKVEANSFNVTTLHEIGHAVDEKNKIMESNQSKPGCGGWKVESPESVAEALLDTFRAVAGASDQIQDEQVLALLTSMLKTGKAKKPPGVTDDDFGKFSTFANTNCLPLREDADPWFNTPLAYDGRIYQEAYGDEWYSYDVGARRTTKVNGYQWRSPAEWFAEVYAITWLAKKPPPSGVDASAAKFMWKAKA